MEKWVVRTKYADFQGIAAEFGIDPLTARLIRNRGMETDSDIRLFLHGDLGNLHDPMLMRDMDRACAILSDKIRQKKRLRVIGDYDADGVMSSYILLKGLKELGACADVRIPDRFADGYGVNERMILSAKEEGIDTIITCDNGIAAVKEAALAKELGMTFIVTDHHEVSDVPPADAVIDVRREEDDYPYKDLCGAGVAWKLIRAMGGDRDLRLLPFAAFATVTDVVPLAGENRIIVREGLRLLESTENTGLIALADACGIDRRGITPYHIGFVLGPAINAAGRLSSAMLALELLTEKDPAKASERAAYLRELNEQRKDLTAEGTREAMRILEEDPEAAGEKVYVLYLPNAHASVIGIIAGRIREITGHPCYILADGADGVKGSGRSTDSYNMYENLWKVRDLLKACGGHPKAAGLTLDKENIGAFREAINAGCTLEGDDFARRIILDAAMPFSYVTKKLVKEFALLEPFGTDNERPLFGQKNVRLRNISMIGRDGKILKALAEAPGLNGFAEVIAFRNGEELQAAAAGGSPVSLAYYPSINSFQGSETLQFVIESFMPES